jgi:SAM-dependent methyltransferase
MKLGETFEASAALYQSARPAYPAQLFDDLTAVTNIVPPAELLEIGAGPGRATVDLARRGYTITALEPGVELAHQARLNLAPYPNLSVVTTSFEQWDPPAAAAYDLAYAANSWHWLDPEIRWSKTAGVLKPAGYLAIFGASHALPEGFDPFFTEIQAVYDEIGEGMDDWPPPPPALGGEAVVAEAAASGLFQVMAQRMYVWALRYDAAGYINLLDTFSGHIAMDDDKRSHLYAEIRRLLADRPDGQLTRHWVSKLVIAQRT